MGRVLVFFLGLVVAGLGWAIHDPAFIAALGPLAGVLPAPIPLGPAEPYRGMVAAVVGGLGVLLLLGAIAGHRKPRRRPRGYAPPRTLTLDAEEPTARPEPAPVAVAGPPAAILAAQPTLALAPEPQAEAPAAPEPTPEPGPVADFPAETLAIEAEPDLTPAPEPFPTAEIAPAAEPESTIQPDHGPEVDLTPTPPLAAPPEPDPEPQPGPVMEVAPTPLAEPIAAASPDAQSFAEAREELRALARQENWPAAGRVLARMPKLAATDAEQALAAQDLGTFYRSQGKTDEAAGAFDEALSYARSAQDPALLAGALTDVGDVAMEEHRLDAALACYSELLELRRGAVAAEPTPENRRLLSLALERLADAREDRGHRTRALELYRESLAIAGELAASNPAKYGAELAVTRDRVAELEARLA